MFLSLYHNLSLSLSLPRPPSFPLALPPPLASARWTHRSPADLSPEERRAYSEAQSALSRLGVTTLLAHIIGALAADISEDGLPELCLELLVEMLNGGNVVVQSALYDYLVRYFYSSAKSPCCPCGPLGGCPHRIPNPQ